MKHNDKQLTIDEVEILCQQYLDCQLSLLEETELEYLLLSCDYQSSLIDETKDVMALSQSIKFAKTKTTRGNWNWVLRAAACVAIVLGAITLYLHFNNINTTINNDYCVAYVSGKRASDQDAHKIAEADVARMQQFILIVNEKKAQEESKVEQFMNHINQSK